MNKILLLGTMPPPIGGVTIHIDRFFNRYKYNNKYEFAVFDIKKRILFKKDEEVRNIFSIIFFFLSTSVVHIHISNDYIKLFFAFISKILLKKIIYTHHNSLVKNKNVFNVMYKLCNKVILVNDKEIDKSLIIDKKTEIIPAFLPPYQFEFLPEELLEEIKIFEKVISTNCYLYNLINGKHVYGFDLIIEAFYNLSKNGKIENTLLILVDPSNTTRKFVNDLLKNKDFGTNKVLHIVQKLDFSSLVRKSDITIRATRTDGDSLSVRESLYFNVPIIASDVTVRPEGTITFKNDDIVDLENKILKVLENKVKFEYKHIDYGQQILNLYSELKIYK